MMNSVENGMKCMLDLLGIENEVLITAIFMKVVELRAEFARRRVVVCILYRLCILIEGRPVTGISWLYLGVEMPKN